MSKLFNVFRSEHYVGDFYQGSFSTEAKAKKYIELTVKKDEDNIELFFIEETEMDELLEVQDE
jgi:hypothetical protein